MLRGFGRVIKCFCSLAMVLVFSTNLTACTLGSNDLIGHDDTTADSVKVMDISLSEEPYGIGVNKEDPELLAKVNEFISYMNENGKFDEIISHYEEGGKPEPVISAPLSTTTDQLIVATTGEFEPFDYDIDDEYFGIDREIAAALADYLGKQLVLVRTNFDIMFLSVYEHKCDVCIAGITINKAREKYVSFSDPYYIAKLSLATMESNKYFKDAGTKEDVERILSESGSDLIVGVENQTTGLFYCEDGAEYGHKEFPVTINKYENLSSCIANLKQNNIDCIIGDYAVMKYIISTSG